MKDFDLDLSLYKVEYRFEKKNGTLGSWRSFNSTDQRKIKVLKRYSKILRAQLDKKANK